MKRLLASLFYVALTVLGLNFLIVALFIAAQHMSGKLPSGQMGNIMRVLAGKAMYILPAPEYGEYREFVADREALRKEMTSRYGGDADRAAEAEQARLSVETLRDNLAIATRQIEDARSENQTVRRQVETLKTALDRQQRMFQDDVARRAAVEMAADTRRFRAIMPNTDAANTARMLETMPEDEAARMMRDNFPPDYTAEVIDELLPDTRPVLVPKLENRYAGVSAEQIARMWRDRNYGAAEMAMYMTNMNSRQALATFLALPPQMRESLEPLLVAPQTATP